MRNLICLIFGHRWKPIIEPLNKPGNYCIRCLDRDYPPLVKRFPLSATETTGESK